MNVATMLKVTVYFLLLILLAGCTHRLSSASYTSLSPSPVDNENALVSVYLTATGDCQSDISFSIDSIEIYDGAAWFPLSVQQTSLEYQHNRNKQILLGLTGLPPGDYSQARLHLSDIERGKGTQKEGMTLTSPISRGFNLSLSDSKCLFLTWHLDDCLTGNSAQLPRFSIQGQAPTVSGETLYVVCDGIDTLYFVRSDTHFVVASMGFSGQLGEVKFDEINKTIYLLSPSSRALYVIDSVNRQIIDRIPLQALLKPQFMALSEDGNFAYVTDSDTAQVSMVDLVSRTVSSSVVVGASPERIVFFEDSGRGQLAISSKNSQQVFIINADTLDAVTTLSVDISPGELVFFDGLLYVADRGSNAVITFDLVENRVAKRINVGSGPISLISNDQGRIFVGQETEGSLAVIVAGQFAVQRLLQVDHGTFDLALLQGRQILYAAHQKARKVSVIDLSLEKKIQEISLGGNPFSIEVQE